jgi:putative heme-binding domain-containing protein
VALIHRLWLMAGAKDLPAFILRAAMNDERPALRKNGMRVAAATLGTNAPNNSMKQAVLGKLSDPDERVQLEAIIALGSFPVDEATARALLKVYPQAENGWVESAVAGVASRNPIAFIHAALAAEDPGQFAELTRVLTVQVAQRAETDPDNASAAVIAASAAPARADALKAMLFETLAKSLKPEFSPKWTEPLRAAFQKTLNSDNPSVPVSALPLIARWDKQGAMSADVKKLVDQLLGKLHDTTQPDDQRARVATSLLGVRQLNPSIVPSVARIVGSSASADLQRRTVEALGATADPSVGPALAEVFAKLQPETQDSVFAQLIKRSDWSLAIVDGLKNGKVTLASLNPTSVHRLRTHADGRVARRANEVIDELRGPEVKEKNALIAKFDPEVAKPGNMEKGREIFAQNCAVCHRFNGEGKELAPDLTGMGVHGAHELLVHILDPNRMVEENYMSVSIETKDGETYDGIIGRENRSAIVLRNAVGDNEIKTADIRSRRLTGRSLMPEGFEALGAEALRDMLTYMMGSDGKYRVIDLKGAFTADTRRGLFNSQEAVEETLRFRKFGIVKVGDVPFGVENPARVTTGNNVVVLKGGNGFARTLPQKVEIENINAQANRLHFLGGVGGWAYPCCGGDGNKDLPVAKATVIYSDGGNEEFVFRNGVEFADYISPANDVPGSRQVPDLVSRGQVRQFTRELKKGGTIQKIMLESYANAVAPVFVAITAESGPAVAKVADASANAAVAADVRTSTAAGAPLTWGAGPKVLLVGGGSAHDFNRFFNRADSEILKAAGCSVNYTEDAAVTARELPRVDVVVLSVNKAGWDTPDVRKAIFDFADAGKGIVLLHAGVWLNYPRWPEYNAKIVGGASRGHDRLGEFEVKVLTPTHPIMKDVPATFRITDELYYFNPDPAGAPLQILAQTSISTGTKKEHPSVWVVGHPKARIAAIALGHDARAHDLPAFKTLLQNAVNWAARKD